MEKLPTGRVAGRGAVLWNKLTGRMPEVGTFQSVHGAAVPIFARVIGSEVGNLNEFEQKRAADINPNLIKTKEELSNMIGFTRKVLERQKQQAAKTMHGGMFGGGVLNQAPAEDDPLAEFGMP